MKSYFKIITDTKFGNIECVRIKKTANPNTVAVLTKKEKTLFLNRLTKTSVESLIKAFREEKESHYISTDGMYSDRELYWSETYLTKVLKKHSEHIVQGKFTGDSKQLSQLLLKLKALRKPKQYLGSRHDYWLKVLCKVLTNIKTNGTTPKSCSGSKKP